MWLKIRKNIYLNTAINMFDHFLNVLGLKVLLNEIVIVPDGTPIKYKLFRFIVHFNVVSFPVMFLCVNFTV